RRHAARGRSDRGAGDPADRLPQSHRAVLRAVHLGVRPRARQPGRVLPGQERRDQAQRAEPGNPLDPRHRRGDRLRAAARLVLPGRNSAGEHGRWVFWPSIPHVGTEGPETRGIWARVARLVGTRPRQVAIGSGIGLLILAAFLPTLKAEGVKQSDTFLTTVES